MGIQQLMVATPDLTSHVLALIPGWDIADTSYGTPYCAITIGTDGSIAVVKSWANAIGASAWYTPITGGIGTGYWVKASYNGYHYQDTGTIGSWLQLNAARTWSVTAAGGTTGGGDLGYAKLKLEFSTDVSGTPLVGTMLCNLWAERPGVIQGGGP